MSINRFTSWVAPTCVTVYGDVMHPKDLDDYEYGHWPELIHLDDDNLSIPMEICSTCSDSFTGLWVPASFCQYANEKMAAIYEERENR